MVNPLLGVFPAFTTCCRSMLIIEVNCSGKFSSKDCFKWSNMFCVLFLKYGCYIMSNLYTNLELGFYIQEFYCIYVSSHIGTLTICIFCLIWKDNNQGNVWGLHFVKNIAKLIIKKFERCLVLLSSTIVIVTKLYNKTGF